MRHTSKRKAKNKKPKKTLADIFSGKHSPEPKEQHKSVKHKNKFNPWL